MTALLLVIQHTAVACSTTFQCPSKPNNHVDGRCCGKEKSSKHDKSPPNSCALPVRAYVRAFFINYQLDAQPVLFANTPPRSRKKHFAPTSYGRRLPLNFKVPCNPQSEKGPVAGPFLRAPCIAASRTDYSPTKTNVFPGRVNKKNAAERPT